MALAACGMGVATGQDFGINLPDDDVPGADLPGAVGTRFSVQGLTDSFRESEGFFYGVGARGSYNSNLFLDESGEVDDIIFSLRPWVRYQSAAPGGARLVANGFYAPNYEKFTNNPNFDRLNHTLNGSLQLNGARSSVRVQASYLRTSSSNRFAGTFSESSTVTGSISGNYEVSPKTSVAMTWGFTDTEFQQAAATEFTTYSAQLTGWWEATPLVRIGPSLRHTETESTRSGDREAWALLVRGAYSLSDKLRVNAAAGVETQELTAAGGRTSDGTQFTGSIGANWRLDAIWSFQFGLGYRSTPSLSTANYYVDNLGFDASVTRNLPKGALEAGFSFDQSDYEQSGPVATPREDEKFWSIFAGYQRPLFRDSMSLNSSVRFSENSGLEDWSNVQLSVGINYVF
ncbi:MAG: hypothetical protein HKN82_02015 [Akkermansiaceae bacterium]|nr:hypothetical protein [Akkermansiaceae bacterium]